MFVPSESLYTQGNRSRSTNALLLIALKVASGPSFLNCSCTRRTIAMASSRVPNSAADTDSTDVATNEAPKIKAARRTGARCMDLPLILTVQDWRSSGRRRKEAVLASGVPSDRLVFEAPQRHQQVHFIPVIGANVNLANIRMNDLVSLETLRCGLRFETLNMMARQSG